MAELLRNSQAHSLPHLNPGRKSLTSLNPEASVGDLNIQTHGHPVSVFSTGSPPVTLSSTPHEAPMAQTSLPLTKTALASVSLLKSPSLGQPFRSVISHPFLLSRLSKAIIPVTRSP